MTRPIYLCGPIADRTDAQCVHWREEAARLWAPDPVLDPMRRDYRGVQFFDRYSAAMLNDLLRDKAQNVVQQDLNDIDQCVGVIAVIDAPSTGTAMEVFYAKTVRNVPVVLVLGEGYTHPSPWLIAHSDHVATSLKSGLALLREAIARQERDVVVF